MELQTKILKELANKLTDHDFALVCKAIELEAKIATNKYEG